MTVRSALYRAARLLGTVDAVRRRRVPQRVVNIGIGRLAARVLGRLWR